MCVHLAEGRAVRLSHVTDTVDIVKHARPCMVWNSVAIQSTARGKDFVMTQPRGERRAVRQTYVHLGERLDVSEARLTTTSPLSPAILPIIQYTD